MDRAEQLTYEKDKMMEGNRIGLSLGNYRLVRLLGRGSFSEVYLGEHVHLRTFAAIRVFPTFLADNEVERFGREVRVLAGLQHPNIVPILDFGVEKDTLYLVMCYAPN